MVLKGSTERGVQEVGTGTGAVRAAADDMLKVRKV